MLQLEELGSRKILLEAQDVLDLRPPERIDALRIVSHHTNIAVTCSQLADDDILGKVGVLILVHQNVSELLLIFGQYIGPVTHQDIGIEQQVVKIHRSVFAAFAHVELVDVQKLRNP